MIRDNFGRPVLNLRISVTQRCNLQCPYCHREGQERSALNPSFEMTATEIVQLVKVAVGLGIQRIKLTGGEPLLRKDILDIVKDISDLQGVEDLSMTTNGTCLASVAKELRASGLTRVNVSLPSLKPQVYKRLMGGDLTDVVSGIKTAVDVGLHPVKVNMLVLANVNEDEIRPMIRFAEENKALLQLIELEPVNISESYYRRYHYALDDIQADFDQRAVSMKVRPAMQNRRIYDLPEGRVEVIRPTENSEFCAHCTRLRITSDGKLKPCLMINTNLVDVLTPLRKGATERELSKIFEDTCRSRTPYFALPPYQTAK